MNSDYALIGTFFDELSYLSLK